MAKIDGIIQAQNYERIAMAIGEILYTEIHNQEALTGTSLVKTFCYERFVPVDETEMTTLNVQYAGSDFSNKDQSMVEGLDTYYISVVTAEKSTPTIPGYLSASRKVSKVLGICRAILENPKYNNLGFEQRGFIKGSIVSAIRIPKNESSQDADNVIGGYLEFKVRAAEYVQLVEPKFLATSLTRVRLYMTRKGYVWGPVDDATYLEAELATTDNPIYLINSTSEKYLIKE